MILMPLIYELSDLNLNFNVKALTPYITILIAVLLVSKLPTLSLKKISISPRATVFILLGIGMIFISLLYFTFETLLLAGVLYLVSIPVSFVAYKSKIKKTKKYRKMSERCFIMKKSKKKKKAIPGK